MSRLRDKLPDYQVLTLRRLMRFAFAFAGRAPWLAFFNLRCGLAMILLRSSISFASGIVDSLV